MREILFRGRRVDNGEWETGSLVYARRGTSEEQASIADKMTAYHTPVIPETVGQYTGLTDMNGTKIFEGDIVKVENALVRGIFAVEYCGISACFIVSHGERRYFLGGCNSEVIGNIHDNPELIGGV